jgi:hypothetical protein
MVAMDIADLDHNLAGRRNGFNDHASRWLRSPSSTVTIGPSNWVIALNYQRRALSDDMHVSTF